VILVHHDRKQGVGAKADPDVFTRISGTRGITGAADTLLFLETNREERGLGTLHITGRDVAEQQLELRKAGPLWMCTSVPET
jgi:hypothetical protein